MVKIVCASPYLKNLTHSYFHFLQAVLVKFIHWYSLIYFYSQMYNKISVSKMSFKLQKYTVFECHADIKSNIHHHVIGIIFRRFWTFHLDVFYKFLEFWAHKATFYFSRLYWAARHHQMIQLFFIRLLLCALVTDISWSIMFPLHSAN